MPSDLQRTAARPVSTRRAVRHHLVLVIACLLLGAAAAYLYAGAQSTAYTSSTRILVNPSVGNPFVPTPSSVRQDELTSLETEAQVVSSDEVLEVVAAGYPAVTLRQLQRNVQVTIPPNTQ